MTNRLDTAVRVRSVRVRFMVDGVRGPLRMFRNGYQSWSPTGVATLGVDADPSHARPGARRSCTPTTTPTSGRPRRRRAALRARDRAGRRRRPTRVLVGFDGGDRHDGTFRLRPTADGPVVRGRGVPRRRGARRPGEQRELHGFVVVERGDDHRHAARALGGARSARRDGARIGAPFQVGWCSWYHYFDGVTEADLRREPRPRRRLAVRGLPARRRLPADDRRLARDQRALPVRPRRHRGAHRGCRAPAGHLDRPVPRRGPTRRSPASTPTGSPGTHRAGHAARSAWWNPAWGGADAHVASTRPTPRCSPTSRRVARSLVEAGFTLPQARLHLRARRRRRVPRPHPHARRSGCGPGTTPSARGAGDDTFLLGCGAPLGSTIGVGRRHAHRRRRRPALGRLRDGQYRPGPLRDRGAGDRRTAGATRWPGRSCTGASGSTTPTA